MNSDDVAKKIISCHSNRKNVLEIGNWKLIRESDFPDDEDDGRDREWNEIND